MYILCIFYVFYILYVRGGRNLFEPTHPRPNAQTTRYVVRANPSLRYILKFSSRASRGRLKIYCFRLRKHPEPQFFLAARSAAKKIGFSQLTFSIFKGVEAIFRSAARSAARKNCDFDQIRSQEILDNHPGPK